MIDLNNLMKIKKKSTNKKVKPGSYTCETTSVEWAEGFVPGSALRIFYELTDEKGEKYTFDELYYVKNNTRTDEFLDYLEDNNIEDVNDLVGVKEEVVIQNNVKRNVAYPQITERHFIK